MRDVLASCRKNPQQKFKAIENFSHDLFSQKALKDWGVIIDTEPMVINSSILPTPVIDMSNGRTQACNDNTLRNLPI